MSSNDMNYLTDTRLFTLHFYWWVEGEIEGEIFWPKIFLNGPKSDLLHKNLGVLGDFHFLLQFYYQIFFKIWVQKVKKVQIIFNFALYWWVLKWAFLLEFMTIYGQLTVQLFKRNISKIMLWLIIIRYCELLLLLSSKMHLNIFLNTLALTDSMGSACYVAYAIKH